MQEHMLSYMKKTYIKRKLRPSDMFSPVMPAACALAANLWKPVGGFSGTYWAREGGLGVRVSKIGKILQIFGGLVLGCIKTKCF